MPVKKKNLDLTEARNCLTPLLSISPRAYQSNRNTRTNGWIRLAKLLDAWLTALETGTKVSSEEVTIILDWSKQELHLPKSKRDSEYRNLCYIVMVTALLVKSQVTDD